MGTSTLRGRRVPDSEVLADGVQMPLHFPQSPPAHFHNDPGNLY